MRFEIWGNSIATAFLALRLKKLGTEVSWVCTGDPLEETRVRPIRIGAESRTLLRDLQSAYTRPLHLWKFSESFSSWAFEDELQFRPISVSLGRTQDSWISSKALLRELRTILEIARVPMIEKDATQFRPTSFLETRTIQIVDFSPEQVESMRGLYYPERLSRPMLFERSWELAFKESARRSSTIAYHGFAGSRGILECTGSGSAYLTLFASTMYSLERAEIAVSDPRGAAPMPWKALFLQSEKLQYRESQRAVGPAHLEIPGVYQMGRAIGAVRPWSNLESDQSVQQAERLFRHLYHLSTLRNPTLDARDWNESEGARFRGFLRRAKVAEDLIFSTSAQKWVSSASMFLPTQFRNYLNLPV